MRMWWWCWPMLVGYSHYSTKPKLKSFFLSRSLRFWVCFLNLSSHQTFVSQLSMGPSGWDAGGHQEAAPALPVQAFCQASVQRTEAPQAHEARERRGGSPPGFPHSILNFSWSDFTCSRLRSSGCLTFSQLKSPWIACVTCKFTTADL